MLVISTISILLFAAGAVFRRLQEQASHSNPDRKILRLGVQIICGDCCGDADRPVKTYIDQFGRCVQCGGSSYVLASMYATQMMKAFPLQLGETTNNVRRPSFGSEVNLHAVRIHKIGA